MSSFTEYRIGEATITRVTDVVLDQLSAEQLFVNWNPELPRRHPDWFLPGTMSDDDTHVLLSIHSWVIRHRGQVILVDTGSGNHKERPHAMYFNHLQTAYLEGLANVDVRPEDVDIVMTTHLHVDHVGWNTRLEGGKWVPTFPNARYFFSKLEHRFYNDPSNHTERNRTSFQVQEDSVNPIVEAGLATLLDNTERTPVAGFELYPTPGHSPGHVSIVFRSGHDTALFSGDILHHPIQVFDPTLITIFDADQEAALKHRRWGLNFTADHKALFFSPHFAATSVGRVLRSSNDQFSWEFL